MGICQSKRNPTQPPAPGPRQGRRKNSDGEDFDTDTYIDLNLILIIVFYCRNLIKIKRLVSLLAQLLFAFMDNKHYIIHYFIIPGVLVTL